MLAYLFCEAVAQEGSATAFRDAQMGQASTAVVLRQQRIATALHVQVKTTATRVSVAAVTAGRVCQRLAKNHQATFFGESGAKAERHGISGIGASEGEGVIIRRNSRGRCGCCGGRCR